jgi:hypothetical protein
VECGGDERLARTGGGIEDDIARLEEGQDRFLLRRVEGDAPDSNKVQETSEQHIVCEFRGRGNKID